RGGRRTIATFRGAASPAGATFAGSSLGGAASSGLAAGGEFCCAVWPFVASGVCLVTVAVLSTAGVVPVLAAGTLVGGVTLGFSASCWHPQIASVTTAITRWRLHIK